MANVFESDWDVEIPEPWSLRFARVGHQAGSERLGATVYEVEPGGVVSPLHTHFANEELVVALSGPVTQPARVLVISETRTPEVAEHLDSGKVLVLEETGGAEGPTISAFRREDAVDRMADEPGG